jgi:gas vesicle protein GvpN
MTISTVNTKRTILKVRPGQFVVTPAIEKLANRALMYLKSGFSLHLRGAAGTGKTTLALHLADRLANPIMLVFGDDQFTSADLIGSQSGYTQKKLVDNFIHSVLKVEDEVKQNWVDSRLTVACREGFTLVYDEFNRSRPEVNNVLLSALEEKLIALPPSYNRPEYLHVHTNFRAIFTSNPEEYSGVHDTQDALLDRLITISMPEPDELTQAEIIVQKIGLNRDEAFIIVRVVKNFRNITKTKKISGLRPCIMIAKICAENEINISPDDANFRDICADILLSRCDLPSDEATTLLWEVINSLSVSENDIFPEININDSENIEIIKSEDTEVITTEKTPLENLIPYELEIYNYLQDSKRSTLISLQQDLNINRSEAGNALRALLQKGLVLQRDRLYIIANEI